MYIIEYICYLGLHCCDDCFTLLWWLFLHCCDDCFYIVMYCCITLLCIVLQELVHLTATSAVRPSNTNTIWRSINVYIVAKNRSSVRSAANASAIPARSVNTWTIGTNTVNQTTAKMTRLVTVHKGQGGQRSQRSTPEN